MMFSLIVFRQRLLQGKAPDWPAHSSASFSAHLWYFIHLLHNPMEAEETLPLPTKHLNFNP